MHLGYNNFKNLILFIELCAIENRIRFRTQKIEKHLVTWSTLG